MTNYLDNASTSWPKPPCVIEAMQHYINNHAANPGRGAHKMALASEKIITDCRNKITQLINADALQRVIFTLNASDALNTAIHGVIKACEQNCTQTIPHVVTTTLEHNSIRRPLNILEQEKRITLTFIDPEPDGLLNPQTFVNAINDKTVLVAFTHASNVLGTIQPLSEIAYAVKMKNQKILTLVDASQTLGVIPVDVQKSQIDLLAAPGHKGLLGPTGTGFLYISPRAYDPGNTDSEQCMKTYRAGGTGGDSITPTQPTDLPVYFEAGTPNTVGIAGLSAGLDYIRDRSLTDIHQHENELVNRFINRFSEQSKNKNANVRLFGTDQKLDRVGLVSILIKGYEPTAISAILDSEYDIAIRPGLHCAPGAHKLIGTFPDGTVRISPGPFSTVAEIDAACDAIEQIVANSLS